MGIRTNRLHHLTPWQNGFGRRLIGSIRPPGRVVLATSLFFVARHISPKSEIYARYYNASRTPRSAIKMRRIRGRFQLIQVLISFARHLGGLHHHYAGFNFSVHPAVYPLYCRSQGRPHPGNGRATEKPSTSPPTPACNTNAHHSTPRTSEGNYSHKTD